MAMAAGERCLPGGPKVGVGAGPRRRSGAGSTEGMSSRGCAVGEARVLDCGRTGMAKGRSVALSGGATGAASAGGDSAVAVSTGGAGGMAPARPGDSAAAPARVASSSSGRGWALNPNGGGSDPPVCPDCPGVGQPKAGGICGGLASITAVVVGRGGWAWAAGAREVAPAASSSAVRARASGVSVMGASSRVV